MTMFRDRMGVSFGRVFVSNGFSVMNLACLPCGERSACRYARIMRIHRGIGARLVT